MELKNSTFFFLYSLQAGSIAIVDPTQTAARIGKNSLA